MKIDEKDIRSIEKFLCNRKTRVPVELPSHAKIFFTNTDQNFIVRIYFYRDINMMFGNDLTFTSLAFVKQIMVRESNKQWFLDLVNKRLNSKA